MQTIRLTFNNVRAPVPSPVMSNTGPCGQPSLRPLRRRPQVVEIEVSDNLSLADLKRLWEFELFMNSLPGFPIRLRLEVEDGKHSQ